MRHGEASARSPSLTWLPPSFVAPAARDYPVYGTQWHPEKNAFEFNKAYVAHSPAAVRTSFYAAEFFVKEGRRKRRSAAALGGLLTRASYRLVSPQPGRTNTAFGPRPKNERR